MDKDPHSKGMINFTFSALPGPVFGARLVGVPEGAGVFGYYQTGFKPLLYGILAALVLMKETGSAAKKKWLQWTKY